VPVPGGETWVTPIWAAMALVLLALAWLMRRRTFLFQAMTLAVAVVARGLILDLFAQGVPDFWHSPLFHFGVTALVLLAALPLAFKLRGDAPFGATTASLPPDIGAILRHPEQLFFFSAFALEVVALAAKLTSGHITIAWSLLGLAVFLFALLVGERSFRLAGLGLLLLSVTKIIVMDIWKLSPSDRYTTLIVLGLALLLVSWLYTRFASVIRKFL
jgi:MYXO-CTERM domain-containing protein